MVDILIIKTQQLIKFLGKNQILVNLENLVYYEIFDDIENAIKREKQLKNWHRDWKINLINDFNKEWKDLYENIL